jgi:hypothetical protein
VKAALKEISRLLFYLNILEQMARAFSTNVIPAFHYNLYFFKEKK